MRVTNKLNWVSDPLSPVLMDRKEQEQTIRAMLIHKYGMHDTVGRVEDRAPFTVTRSYPHDKELTFKNWFYCTGATIRAIWRRL